ncbi:MAG TPA: ABC transporter substrate-binding protein [Candidatus Binatia bacterium]|nr:ABC transporter substrate-binding protein [Candidatus Binatia bacterium]
MQRLGTLVAAALLGACSPSSPTPADGPGVDAQQKQITIGTLNDESGPAAVIGRPWALGKRILARQINEGGSGLLPDGWRVTLLERDHGYDTQRALQGFDELRGRVLFFGTSFGTPQTLALAPRLARDRLVAFPASLCTRMQESEYTPPLGPTYRVETLRGIEWAVQQSRAAKVRLGVVWQDDDYGRDALAAAQAAAKRLGLVEPVARSYDIGQPDYTAVVAALKRAGVTHVVLATVPNATGPILGIAAQLDFHPLWLGNSPSWLDRFFDPKVVPPQLFGTYYWLSGTAYWGENVPFMRGFLAAYEKFGREAAAPDFYILASYAQGLLEMEVARRMIAAGQFSREGYRAALRSLKGYDAQRVLPQPLDFTRFPYVSGTQARVLKPEFGSQTWKVVAPYATPTDPPAGDAHGDD